VVMDRDSYGEAVSIQPLGARESNGRPKPPLPGEYVVKAFSSTGDYSEVNITVTDVRYITIQNVSFPAEVKLGDYAVVNVTVKGPEKERMGGMSVSLGTLEESRQFIIGNQEKTFLFSMQTTSPGRNDLSVDVFSGDRYEAGFSGSVNVVQEKGFFDKLIEQATGFFLGLSAWFSG